MRELHTRVEKTLALLERQFPVDTEKFACDVRQLLAAQAVQPESIDTPVFRAIMSDLIARKAKQSDLVRFIDDKIRGADAGQARELPPLLTDEDLCAVDCVERTLRSIAERSRLVGDVIEPVNDIRTASALAKEAFRRFAPVSRKLFDATDTAPAASSVNTDAEQISTLREAVIDAADGWSNYVEVDSAPISCSEHVGMAFDAAVAANLKGASK